MQWEPEANSGDHNYIRQKRLYVKTATRDRGYYIAIQKVNSPGR